MKCSLWILLVVLVAATVVCYFFSESKEMASSLTGLLGGLFGIVFGSYFIQREVNRESSLKDTCRWLIQKIDEYEKDACDCCFLTQEEQQQRIVLASRLKSDFPVLSNIYDACVRDKKQDEGNRALKILFDAATGDNFEFSPPRPDDVRLKIQQITCSCSQLKRIVSQCL